MFLESLTLVPFPAGSLPGGEAVICRGYGW